MKFSNINYRLRSTLASSDSVAVSGSEDGRVFVWDVLEGNVVCELWQDDQFKGQQLGKKSVISSVCECPVRKEWASAGGDGKLPMLLYLLLAVPANRVGSVMVWGLG
jgi:mitogen-activated protein kinase organizer 1